VDEAVRIAFEAGVPYTGLRDFHPDERLWALVDPAWARRERIVPLLIIGDRLQVAAVAPDVDLTSLEDAFGGVDLVIAPAHEIDAVLAEVDVEPAAERRRVGELLAEHGATTQEAIAAALTEQERTGALLGDILLARGAVTEEELLDVLAEHFALPRIALADAEPEPEALALVDEELQRRLRCVPIAVDDDAVYVAVGDPVDERSLALLRDAVAPREPRLFLAARDEVDHLLAAHHADAWAARVAAQAPAPIAPRRAARAAVGVVAGGTAAGLIVAPDTTAIALAALAALLTAGPALAAFVAALLGARRRTPAPVDDDRLPVISLLLPMDGGPGAAVRAAGTLATLDYPFSHLEILLLCREPDASTVRAARRLARRRPHRLVLAPASLPPGHPALLSYGLLLARGELVGVLEPGDVPDPRLLRTAVAALEAGGRRVAAAQGSLAPPTKPGALGAWPAGARAAWHELLAPGVARLRLPLPLSDTGLVARRSSLEAVGGWDPTSTSDGPGLGLRLAGAGLVGIAIDAAVGAPGPGPAAAWLDAQTRWWRDVATAWSRWWSAPARRDRRGRPRTALGATTIGVALLVTPLVWPLVVAATVVAVLQLAGAIGTPLPELAAWLLVGQTATMLAVLVDLVGIGSLQRRAGGTVRAVAAAPLGLTLASAAAWRGALGRIR